jgi:hypothetical protein
VPCNVCLGTQLRRRWPVQSLLLVGSAREYKFHRLYRSSVRRTGTYRRPHTETSHTFTFTEREKHAKQTTGFERAQRPAWPQP